VPRQVSTVSSKPSVRMPRGGCCVRAGDSAVNVCHVCLLSAGALFENGSNITSKYVSYVFCSGQRARLFSVCGGRPGQQRVLAYIVLLPSGTALPFHFGLHSTQVLQLEFLCVFAGITCAKRYSGGHFRFLTRVNLLIAHHPAAGRRQLGTRRRSSGQALEVPSRSVQRGGLRGAAVPGYLRGRHKGMGKQQMECCCPCDHVQSA
jgi:hypothetical protein